LFKRYDNEWPVAHGIELKDETWIHGYGLDNEKGLGRNLPYILGDLTEVE
jgi:hypoxanthine-guanine phosphoribosyltransferase